MVARYSTGNRRIDTGLMNVIVAGLFSYPVKSFRACSRQSLTMGREISWWHTYSHAGEVWNEIVDDIVAFVSFSPAYREPHVAIPSLWGQKV